MTFDARAVANLVLDLADEERLPLSHMSVHKIMFFANGWHLAAYDAPLIDEQFEAWKYGPVLRTVWEAFKHLNKREVDCRAEHFDPITEELYILQVAIPHRTIEFLRSILLEYGPISPLQLSDMTHQIGGAWDRTWNAPRDQARLGMRISDKSIKTEFSFRHRLTAQ